MHYQAFIDSLDGSSSPPPGLGPGLRALWHDRKGDWQRAHAIVQAEGDSTAARIHAYLHRKEGDDWNSRYWHRRAGSQYPDGISHDQEWDQLVRQLTDP